MAARKKAADGEDRLLIRFQQACISADISIRIMAKFDNDVTFLTGGKYDPAPWKGMVRYVDGD